MPRPGFVLDIDKSTPPTLFWRGEGFSLEPQPPEVRLGGVKATIAHASRQSLTVIVPPGLDGGHTPVRVDGAAGEGWTYVYNWPVAGLPQIASGRFLES